MENNIEILKQLVENPGISGAEHNVRDIMLKQMKQYVDEIMVDKIGNLIAR